MEVQSRNPHRLSRRFAVAVVAASMLLAGLPAAAENHPVLAVAPPAIVTGVGPTEDGAVPVQRSAGPVAGQPDGWRMNVNMTLENLSSSEDLVLYRVVIAYEGGSNPDDLEVFTSPDAVHPWAIPRIPRDPDDDDDADEVLPPETILAERRRTAQIPEDRVMPFPLPDQVTVQFWFDGYDLPVSETRALIEYVPPGGVDAFPFAAKDLEPGEYVGTGQNHPVGSNHRGSVTQRHAYDFNFRRWDGGAWVTRDGPSDENESYFIWDRPVYTIADGVILRCFRGVPDNVPGERHPDLLLPEDDPDKMPGGGNMYLIQHAPGEITLYAHFKEGTIPDELCPDAEDDQGLKYPPGIPGTEVKAGQYLGTVGNSGSSGGPHLHIHTQKGHDLVGGGSGSARPMMFENIRAIDGDAYDPDTDDSPAWNDVEGAAVTISGAVVGRIEILPGIFVGGTQVGGFTGYGTVSHLLIDPAPRINLEVTKAADQQPVVAGTDLTYTLSVANHGPETAPDVLLSDHLPPEVELVSDDGGCVPEFLFGPALHCPVGTLAPGESSGPITIVVNVPHDLVHANGGPLTITNRVVAHSFSGPVEATSHDNEAEVDTLVIAVADLELLDVEVVDPPPAQTLIGDPVSVGIQSTITNHGPSWPMDVRVATFPAPATGIAVDPVSVTSVAAAVEIDEVRTIEVATFDLTCLAPGVQEVTFEVDIRPDSIHDIDPDETNNHGEVTVTLECVVPIAINIRPGNQHNVINPGSQAIVPVAALTTDAGEYDLPVAFDATLIDPATVRFGDPDLVWAETGGAAIHGKAHVRDAHELDDKTKDGDDDLVMSFRTSQTGIGHGDVEACMKGLFDHDGVPVPFFGCDSITTIPTS